MTVVNFEWEKFTGGPIKPSSTRMHVTIGRGGRIHLNANLFKRLAKPEAVWLFYNRRLQQIAVQATSIRMPEAFPVNLARGRSTYYFNAASFCIHFGIKLRERHKFNSPHFSSDGKLILNLNDTVIVGRRAKNRAS